MLSKPVHIARAAIDTTEVNYEWHDWRAFDYCQPVDESVVERCAALVVPAVNALTIAEAEWLAFRFDRVSSDPIPYVYLESAWCANVDRHYSWPIEFPKDDWQGPIRRPLLVGIILVNHVLYELEEEDEPPIQQPALVSRFVEHVLPDPAPFLAWRDRCLQRLDQFYRKPVENPFDDLFEDYPRRTLVPREAFDLDFDFRPEQAEILIDRFLRSVDYKANPFLLSPEQMRIEGFEGSPYSTST
jgi:hypothetical protein